MLHPRAGAAVPAARGAPWPGSRGSRCAPGESSTVEIPLPVSSLAFWDVAAHRMTVDPGNYEVMAGSSSDGHTAVRQC